MTRPRALMTIGDFARDAGLTPKALRLYDDLDLLPPAEVDRHSGYRRYSPAQLGRARLVATLRLLGMPLARIRQVLDLAPAAAAQEVEAYWSQVEADTASRRGIVTPLVHQLRNEAAAMTPTTHPLHAELGTSHRQGRASGSRTPSSPRPTSSPSPTASVTGTTWPPRPSGRSPRAVSRAPSPRSRPR